MNHAGTLAIFRYDRGELVRFDDAPHTALILRNSCGRVAEAGPDAWHAGASVLTNEWKHPSSIKAIPQLACDWGIA
jgi:hypothetical protein